MKVTIVINGEAMFSGETEGCMVLMPADNEVQISIGPAKSLEELSFRSMCEASVPLEIGEAGTRAAGMVRERGGAWRHPTPEEVPLTHLARTYPPLFQPTW